MTHPVELEGHDGVAVIRIDSPPVNALSAEVLVGLGECRRAALGDPAVAGIVLTGNGKSFVAGADVTRLEKIARGAPLDVAGVPRLPELIATLESSVKPTVAAIEGFALGGGLELALGCHARVGSPLCRVGLPELLLGLIPGAGGTQRLPRLAGVRAASEMMLSSRQVKAEEALRLGILDEVVPSDELVPRAAALARELGKTERRVARERSDRLEPEAEWREILARAGRELQKKQPHVTHPSACLEAIEHGLVHGGCAGLERERELFLEALASEPARALIHLFFAERAAAKVPGVTDAGLSPRHPSRVVVIGGGTMGSGIATALLDAGVGVGLVEASAALGDAAAARIRKNFARSIEKGRLSAAAAEQRVAGLSLHTELDALGEAGFVIEAATEELDLKRQLFAELGRRTGPDTWLASNTSTIDLELLAEASGAPERVLGLHFFSPAHVMKLVEVVRTPRTSARALSDALALCKRMKKTSVTVGNCTGFLVNRIFMPYSQLTGLLIDRGVDPYRIDRALSEFGMPMGPSRMSDLAGLDVGVAAGAILDAAYPTRAYRSALRRVLVEAGRLGEKTGAGHYRHESGRAEEDPELTAFVARARELAGSPAEVALADAEIPRILLFGVVNEACRALEEGIVLRPSDIDVAANLGMGFPAFRGGPMRWADGIGAAAVHAALVEWRDRFAQPIFEPAPYLADCARTGASLLTRC